MTVSAKCAQQSSSYFGKTSVDSEQRSSNLKKLLPEGQGLNLKRASLCLFVAVFPRCNSIQSS